MLNANFIQIKNIAEAGDYYASVQAQVMLNDLANTGYQPDVVLPSSGQQNLLMPHGIGNTTNATVPYLQVVPNPARQETSFHYQLPEDTHQAQITITAMDGKILERIPITDETGQILWLTEQLKPGMYFYALIVEQKSIKSGRLVIIK